MKKLDDEEYETFLALETLFSLTFGFLVGLLIGHNLGLGKGIFAILVVLTIMFNWIARQTKKK
ncbi:MAG: hypothetical protein ACTSVB_07915 [Candidatus Heimdallarchaeaceae archaeon]